MRDDELPRGSRPLPPAGPEPTAAAARLQLIETAAKPHHDQLGRQFDAQRPCRNDHRAEAVALSYLDRYIDGLFRYPVAREPDSQVLAVLERTNNVAEHFTNLLCRHYVRIARDTLRRLPQALAELDGPSIRASTPLQRNNKDASLRNRVRDWAATDGE